VPDNRGMSSCGIPCYPRRMWVIRRLGVVGAAAAVCAVLAAGLGAGIRHDQATAAVRAVLGTRGLSPAPALRSSRASGLFIATVSGKTLRWRLSFHGLTGPVSAASIHFGAVSVRLCSRCASGARGTTNLSASEASALTGRRAWVDLRTARNPRGELRGQVALGVVPTLEIQTPRDSAAMSLPAPIRYIVTGFTVGPGAGGIAAFVAGADDTVVELQPSDQPGLAYLPDNKLIAGRHDFTFVLTGPDGAPLRNPEARVTVVGMTLTGRR
jgi:hypothetical protein